jgi:hypothetical protein
MWAHAMKSEADRGLIGSWARRARLDAGRQLRGIEAGAHKPSRDLVVKLAALYRSIPPSEEGEGDRWLAQIRSAVAEGVALGVARALAQLAGPQPPPRRPPRQ